MEKNNVKIKYKAYLNLNSKHLVKFDDILETNILVIFLMEPIKGNLTTLERHLKNPFFEDDERRSKFLAKIATILNFLGERGLHHGSLSNGQK